MTETPIRILHILDHSIPLQSGYVFRTMGILRSQRDMGWVTAQLTTPKHHAQSPLQETVSGWQFYRTPRINGAIAKLSPVDQWAVVNVTARRLDEVVREFKPDILHAHSPVLNAMAAFRVAPRFGLPVVYEVRSFWEDAASEHGTAINGGLRYRATRWLETRALRKADAIVAISEGLRRDILDRGIPTAKVALVPNAVNIDEFSEPTSATSDLAARLGTVGSIVVGYIGSFYSYEGLDILLRAIPSVLASQPNLKLLLVGGGPHEQSLRALTESLGLCENVIFVGRVAHEQITDYYQLIDVLIYPRKSGRLTELVTPLKPLEAMAQRRIVLASDVGGHKELIEDGKTGRFFRADDSASLAERLLHILEHSDNWDRMRESGRTFVEKNRTWRAVGSRYADVYARVMSGTRPR